VLEAAEDKLRRLLVPRDPDDDRDIILEVKAGEGARSRLVRRRPAADVPALRRAPWLEDRGHRRHRVRSGRLQDVQVSVKARGATEPGDAPWARLKYEGGVHRVQRVPITESQGASTPLPPVCW